MQSLNVFRAARLDVTEHQAVRALAPSRSYQYTVYTRREPQAPDTMVGLKLEWHQRPGKQGSKLQVGLRGSEHQLMRQKLPKHLLWPRFPARDSGGHDTEDSWAQGRNLLF